MKPNEMSDRQFLGWNVQVRQQLVSDLYDVCQQNGEILEELLDEYVYLLKDNTDRLDKLADYVKEELEAYFNSYENDIDVVSWKIKEVN